MAYTPSFIYSSGGNAIFSNIPIGGVAYASLGTDTTDVNGQFWITDLYVPYAKWVTTVGYLQGTGPGTDNFLAAIWDSTGALVRTTALAGVANSGASTFKEQAWLTPVQRYGPAQYFVAIQGNGTTAASIKTIAASTYLNVVSTVLGGAFGTVPATITVPTTFVALNAPIVYVK